MRIEILYFKGCPNHAPAVTRVSEILKQEGVSAEIVEVEITDPAKAEEVGFLGSPSIRVNGVDVELAARSARSFGFGCRTYEDEGIPSIEWIRRAVMEAKPI